jgi:hypothetical protein
MDHLAPRCVVQEQLVAEQEEGEEDKEEVCIPNQAPPLVVHSDQDLDMD